MCSYSSLAVSEAVNSGTPCQRPAEPPLNVQRNIGKSLEDIKSTLCTARNRQIALHSALRTEVEKLGKMIGLCIRQLKAVDVHETRPSLDCEAENDEEDEEGLEALEPSQKKRKIQQKILLQYPQIKVARIPREMLEVGGEFTNAELPRQAEDFTG